MDCSQHPADHRRMGIYRHLINEQLTTRRDSYLAALDARLTGPTQASGSAEGAGDPPPCVGACADSVGHYRLWVRRIGDGHPLAVSAGNAGCHLPCATSL